MKDYVKIRILQGFLLLCSLFGIVFFDNLYIMLGLVMYGILETLGGNIGLHRYFCHNSFKTSNTIRNILIFFSHYIAVGSVLSWVGQHRYHHDVADTADDVHSPYQHSLLQIFFGVWEMNIGKKYVKDVIRDKTLIYWHKNYFKFHLVVIVFWLLIGPEFLFSFYALPALMCLISGYVLATVTHYHGYKTYAVNDNSTNSWIANLYTLGEGWHNNHHAKPGRLRQGEKWWEWDLPAFIIEKFLTK